MDGGQEANGYAAVDEISFHNFEDCPTIPVYADPHQTTPSIDTTKPHTNMFPNCDFEVNECNWNIAETEFRWKR